MTRPRLAVLGLLSAGAFLLTAAPVHAQSGWGLRTGYSVDPDQFYVGVHAGVVNSSAKVIANGMSRRLMAHRYDDPT